MLLFHSYLADEAEGSSTASSWCGRRTSVLVNVARNTDDVYDEAPSAYSYLNPTRFLKTVRGHLIAEGTPNNIVTVFRASIFRLSVFRIASGKDRKSSRNRLSSVTRKTSSWRAINFDTSFYI